MEKTKRYIPRWVTVALIAAWVLFGGIVAAVILWQTAPKETPPKAPPEQAERSRVFVMGQTVDLSDERYTYEDMAEDLRELCRLYPDRLRMASAGKSEDGREILYADFGDPNAERQFFISAGIHGRETVPPLIAMKLLEYYLINYDTENEKGIAFSDVAGDCMLRVVPMINPDGIALAQDGLSSIRSENLRNTVKSIYQKDCMEYDSYAEMYNGIEEYLCYWKSNLNGVDLNRNFPIEEWNKTSTGISHPSAQKYKGSQAASEPETRAMVDLLADMERLTCVISLHSQGEVLYWNCGQMGALREKNKELAEEIASLTGYRPVNDFTAPDATLDDWAALHLGIPSVNIELGKGSVLLPREQIEPIWETVKGLWQILAEK